MGADRGRIPPALRLRVSPPLVVRVEGRIRLVEETPLVGDPRRRPRSLRTPVARLAATLAFPLPVRHGSHVGAPLRLAGPSKPRRGDRHVEPVRTDLGTLVQHGLAAREHLST
jgi:hypothetical protein